MRRTVRVILAALSISTLVGISATANAANEKSINVAGFDMHYVEQGQGPLLILVHGSFSDNRSWKQQIEILAKDFRVVAPTMRYFGKAPWSDTWPQFSDALLADDLAAFIKGLNSGTTPHLVGWSRGARVAHLTVLRHPEVARSAYLFEGSARINLTEADSKAQKLAGGKLFGPAIKVLKEKGPEASIPKWIDAVVGPGAYVKRSDEQKLMFKDNARTIPISLKAKRTILSCEQLQASKVPTTIVLGTKSTLVGFLKPTADCLPDKILTITDATHGWPGADPNAFASSVKDFAMKH